jgi:hypothetical protein
LQAEQTHQGRINHKCPPVYIHYFSPIPFILPSLLRELHFEQNTKPASEIQVFKRNNEPGLLDFSVSPGATANSRQFFFALSDSYYLSYDEIPGRSHKIAEKSVTFSIGCGT